MDKNLLIKLKWPNLKIKYSFFCFNVKLYKIYTFKKMSSCNIKIQSGHTIHKLINIHKNVGN